MEKALTHKNKPKDDDNDSERYTIFHALFEALKEKDKKGKKN